MQVPSGFVRIYAQFLFIISNKPGDCISVKLSEIGVLVVSVLVGATHKGCLDCWPILDAVSFVLTFYCKNSSFV